MKLGSLFDGSGTAPLAAIACGVEPVWCSEIEPYPISVTVERFPNMKHLGDITKIHGNEVEPVDIIVGGSPCQDLSVAGKQKGLNDGERSHLFFEMTRIIREMRENTNGEYPKYVVWENVPGAFSSNNGEDFLSVLQAFSEIADPDIHVPRPATGGGQAWMEVCRSNQRKQLLYCMEDNGRSILGRSAKTQKNLSRCFIRESTRFR